MSPETLHSEASEPETAPKASRRIGLSIQSKLLIMLLGVGLVSSLVVGAIGFFNGRASLQHAAVEELTAIRETRATAITDALTRAELNVSLFSRDISTQQASVAFNQAFAQLGSRSLSEKQRQQLTDYYADVFVPALEERSGLAVSPKALIPKSDAGQWAQYLYTRHNTAPSGTDSGSTDDESADKSADEKTGKGTDGTKSSDAETGDDTVKTKETGETSDSATSSTSKMLDFNDAGDDSAYTAQVRRYGPVVKRLLDTLEYEELLLLNTEGDVVFSAGKGIELGTNLNDGPLHTSGLAEAYTQVMSSNSIDAIAIADFEDWVPALGEPALWMVSAVGNDDQITGAFAAQIPRSFVNDVMTGRQGWSAQGLGATGEVYLAGRDDLMRSISRELIENPDDFVDEVVAAGTSPEIAQQVVDFGDTTLRQPVQVESVSRALAGETGTAIVGDYIGGESVTAFAPLPYEGLDWVIVARVDSGEAFAPVASFTRTVLLSLVVILVAISILSLLLAQVFTRPLKQMGDAVQRLAQGDLTVQVPTRRRDEFGAVGQAFNAMANNLRVKQEQLDKQRGDHERLLHAIMPNDMAERYERGEDRIIESRDDASVVCAELIGFDRHASRLSEADRIERMGELVAAFDEAAQKAGVETARALHGSYIASSGLVVPRVDSVRRSVEFALLLVAAVERFNARYDASLGMRVGVDSGSVSSGLVGRSTLAYDIWGETVALAHRVREAGQLPGAYGGTIPSTGVFASQRVRDRTEDVFSFTEAGTFAVNDSDGRPSVEPVWRVS
ncbi:MAG: adenylate/guanylate cyclase domain-containing protein [Leucobacter sp.]